MFLLISAIVVLIVIVLKVYSTLTKFRCTSKKSLIGKVAIVTGGISGMGYEIVRDLAARGCKVIIADVINGEKITTKIQEDSENPNIFWRRIDLGSLTSVREFAADFQKKEHRLDILINNAGCAGFTGYTEDGLQKVMQVNYLGHFLLIHLLIDMLKKSDNGRIINVSSSLAFTHWLRSADAINSEPKLKLFSIDTCLLYSNSKLCVLIANKVMAEKLKRFKISCYSVHPGIVYTPMFKSTVANALRGKIFITIAFLFTQIYIFIFGKTIEEGAQAALHCALAKDIDHLSGKYFWDGHVFAEPRIAKNIDFCMNVWKVSEKLVKLTEAEKIN